MTDREHEDGAALAFQALLYASGEMDGPEAAHFEARLGEDQAAREALCQAMQLACPPDGSGCLRPDPAYREQVRRRIEPRRSFWGWLTRKRSYHGHPAAWTGLGAVAGLLIVLGLGHGQPADVRDHPQVADGSGAKTQEPVPPTKTPATRPRDDRPAPEPLANTSTAEAKVWADLQSRMPWRKRWTAGLSVKH
jgi:hypothetical protein